MAEGTITEDMNIKDVIEKHPEAVAVFQKYNMGCIGCNYHIVNIKYFLIPFI